MINTFSANSLKILNENIDEFKRKYIDKLTLYSNDQRANTGQKYHNLICSYIKGFDVIKFEKSLNKDELNNWFLLKEKINGLNGEFIKTEYPFIVKNNLNNTPYYLTGRFDAIYKEQKEKNSITIYDWKTLNIPSDISENIQTIVYLYCAEKIFNSKNIKMKYISIEKQQSDEISYQNEKFYKDKIESIIKKTGMY